MSVKRKTRSKVTIESALQTLPVGPQQISKHEVSDSKEITKQKNTRYCRLKVELRAKSSMERRGSPSRAAARLLPGKAFYATGAMGATGFAPLGRGALFRSTSPPRSPGAFFWGHSREMWPGSPHW